jgi:hypothetical protein
MTRLLGDLRRSWQSIEKCLLQGLPHICLLGGYESSTMKSRNDDSSSLKPDNISQVLDLKQEKLTRDRKAWNYENVNVRLGPQGSRAHDARLYCASMA